MSKLSAGVIVFRRGRDALEVLLVHPGGPFWAKKDLGAWSIPKGEYEPGQDPLEVARREFEEETGCRVAGTFLPLAPVRQASGKVISAWAVEGDFDVASIRSNTFRLEWPPRSGQQREFPEVDRAEWFPLGVAAAKIIQGQRSLLEEVQRVAESASAETRERHPIKEDGSPAEKKAESADSALVLPFLC